MKKALKPLVHEAVRLFIARVESEKAISLPVKDIAQLKVILATWYAYLRDSSDNFTKGDFARYLKTPVIYDLAKDEIEILFTGSEEMLNDFRSHVFKTDK